MYTVWFSLLSIRFTNLGIFFSCFVTSPFTSYFFIHMLWRVHVWMMKWIVTGDVMYCDVLSVMCCDVLWCDTICCDVMWCATMWCYGSDVMYCDLVGAPTCSGAMVISVCLYYCPLVMIDSVVSVLNERTEYRCVIMSLHRIAGVWSPHINFVLENHVRRPLMRPRLLRNGWNRQILVGICLYTALHYIYYTILHELLAN